MVHERVTFPTICDSAKVVQPRVGAFDFVAAGVAPLFATVVTGRLGAILAVWADQLDSLLGQAVSKGIAVISAISNQRYLVGQLHRNVVDSVDGYFKQVGFRAVSLSCAHGSVQLVYENKNPCVFATFSKLVFTTKGGRHSAFRGRSGQGRRGCAAARRWGSPWCLRL